MWSQAVGVHISFPAAGRLRRNTYCWRCLFSVCMISAAGSWPAALRLRVHIHGFPFREYVGRPGSSGESPACCKVITRQCTWIKRVKTTANAGRISVIKRVLYVWSVSWSTRRVRGQNLLTFRQKLQNLYRRPRRQERSNGDERCCLLSQQTEWFRHRNLLYISKSERKPTAALYDPSLAPLVVPLLSQPLTGVKLLKGAKTRRPRRPNTYVKRRVEHTEWLNEYWNVDSRYKINTPV